MSNSLGIFSSAKERISWLSSLDKEERNADKCECQSSCKNNDECKCGEHE